MALKRPPLVITRHPELINYMREIGLITGEIETKGRAQAHDVAGRVVYGVLPYHLAACAEALIYIPVWPPKERQGCDLTIQEIRRYSDPPVIYTVSGRTLEFTKELGWH